VVEFHAKGHGPEHLTRYHSAFIAVRVCNVDGRSGILVTGGWQDYGQRVSGYQGLVLGGLVDQPAPGYASGFAPYLSITCYDDGGQADCADVSGSLATWTSEADQIVEGHHLTQILFRVRDATDKIAGSTRLTGPHTFHHICGGSGAYNPVGCQANNTTGQVHQVFGNVPEAWDTLDGEADGRVTYAGYTDRYGRIVQGCSEIGLDCVPLLLNNVPVGKFGTFYKGPSSGTFSPAAEPERDIYFCGTVVCSETSPGAMPSGWVSEHN
jgi:hypothetical protein